MSASQTTPPSSQAAPWTEPVSGKTLAQVSSVCFLAWVFSVYDFTLFGTLLPKIAEDFGWSTATSTEVNTWVQIGTFGVALAVGPMIDRLGRRSALIITVLGAAIASALTGLAGGFLTVILIRSFAGFGYSEEVVNGVYLNEIYGKARSRGFLYAFVQSGWPVGALLSAGLTALFLPIVGWRWCFVIAAIPSVLVAILATRLPESPAFLALREARRCKAEGNIERAQRIAREANIEVEHASLRELFTPSLRVHTIALSLAWLFNWMAIQVFSVLGTTVLTGGKGVSFDSALMVLVLANATAFAGYLFHGWVGDRFRRRPTIIVGWLVGSVITAAMLLGPDTGVYVIPLYALSLFFLTGPYSALLFYMGESFPAHVRGIGPNVAHVMGPLGAVVGSAVVAGMLNNGADLITAALVAGSLSLLLSGIAMLFTRHVDQHDHLPAESQA